MVQTVSEVQDIKQLGGSSALLLGSENMTFGQNFKQIRKRMNVTQEELAKRTNISRSYLSDIENGNKNPSIQTVKKLADKLGISVNDLFNDSTTI